MIDTLFYTCASGRYQRFIPLYIASALHYFSNVSVEIVVPDSEGVTPEVHEGLIPVIRRFGSERFLLREVSWSGILPHTVRFLTEPSTRLPFTYITDVDMIFLVEDILAQHHAFMARTCLPYSNSVRVRTDQVKSHYRMSGLHFTQTEAMWPIPDLSDLNVLKLNDEKVLYEIIRRRGLRIQDEEWFRPLPGLHTTMSVPMLPNAENNVPGRKTHWNLHNWKDLFLRFYDSDLFKELRPCLPAQTRIEIEALERAFLGPPAA